MKTLVGLLIGTMLLTGAAMANQGHAPASVKATIKDANGKPVGTAVFSEAKPSGVKLDLTITALPPGDHSFHIHQKPVCDPNEEFNTAGLRFDPTGEFYGNADHHAHSGPSAGDPGMMVKVGADGKGHMSAVFPKLTLGDDDHSIFYNGGTAMVFHSAEGADGPTRIACGIIAKPGEKSAKQ